DDGPPGRAEPGPPAAVGAVGHHVARRDRHLEIGSVLPAALVAGSRATVLGKVSGLLAAVKKRAHARAHREYHAPAAAAVAAVRSAARHVLLAPEAHAARSALAGDDVNAR